jgi:SAM-dependent methyltransferase
MNTAELHQMVFRFREARIVFSALELGVFASLAKGARRCSDLAHELELDERGLRVLLDALVAMEVLRRNSDGYALEPACAAALLPGGEDFLGPLFLHDLWHWTSWAHLDRSVRLGLPHRERHNDPHLCNAVVLARFLPNYTLAMEQSARASLPGLVERIAPLGARALLDLGGGSGSLLLALLERSPDARGTLAEHAFALERARELAAEHPAGARLALLELDFERGELPRGHDLIVLSRVLMGLPEPRARALVARAALALEPGGHLVIHDYEASTRVGAVLSVDMLLHCGSEVHAAHEIEDWVEEAKLDLVDDGRVLPYTHCWIGAKP